jgi:zinc finger protein
VSNIEGVLNRFEDAIRLMYRQSKASNEEDIVKKCEDLFDKINLVKNGEMSTIITLLDPMGHSQILHQEAVSRDLTEEEMEVLEIGPSFPVFNTEELE